MANGMIETLTRAAKKKSLVTICINPDDIAESLIGYVETVTSTHLRIQSVNMYGEDDGYEVMHLDSIFMVRQGGIYERKIQFMKDKIGANLFETSELEKSKEHDLIQLTLAQAKNQNLIVRLYNNMQNKLCVGYVDRINSEEVCVIDIDDYGVFFDGKSIVKLSEIFWLRCNSKEDKCLKILYEEFQSNSGDMDS